MASISRLLSGFIVSPLPFCNSTVYDRYLASSISSIIRFVEGFSEEEVSMHTVTKIDNNRTCLHTVLEFVPYNISTCDYYNKPRRSEQKFITSNRAKKNELEKQHVEMQKEENVYCNDKLLEIMLNNLHLCDQLPIGELEIYANKLMSESNGDLLFRVLLTYSSQSGITLSNATTFNLLKYNQEFQLPPDLLQLIHVITLESNIDVANLMSSTLKLKEVISEHGGSCDTSPALQNTKPIQSRLERVRSRKS